MDRVIVYPGSVPLETDILATNKNAMSAVGGLAEALIGGNPGQVCVMHGLSCTPVDGQMAVRVGRGSIYAGGAADETEYSSLGADAGLVVKRGALDSAITLSATAPATAGYTEAWLVQARVHDEDVGEEVLPYFNSADPGQAWSGPGGDGSAQATIRRAGLIVSCKPWAPAPSGTETPAEPTEGYVPLYVVRVPAGATAITQSMISLHPDAPVNAARLGRACADAVVAEAGIGIDHGDEGQLRDAILALIARRSTSWSEVTGKPFTFAPVQSGQPSAVLGTNDSGDHVKTWNPSNFSVSHAAEADHAASATNATNAVNSTNATNAVNATNAAHSGAADAAPWSGITGKPDLIYNPATCEVGSLTIALSGGPLTVGSDYDFTVFNPGLRPPAGAWKIIMSSILVEAYGGAVNLIRRVT